jgi:hypothetical protein
VLADGTYDAIVVDASAVAPAAGDADDAAPGTGDAGPADPARPAGAVSIELTIVAGPAKGEIVTILGRNLGGDPLDLLGVPATLTVTDGAPALRLER